MTYEPLVIAALHAKSIHATGNDSSPATLQAAAAEALVSSIDLSFINLITYVVFENYK